MSRVLNAGQVAEFGHEGDRDSTRDAPQGLQRLDHWLQSPGVPVVMPFLLQTRQAVGLFIDRPDVFLEDDRWRRGGTDHFGEPPQMGRAPGGPARLPAILPQEEGFETKRGGLAVPKSIFAGAGAGEIAPGVVLDRGAIHSGESPRAHQPRPWPRVTTVGVHAVARFLGKE